MQSCLSKQSKYDITYGIYIYILETELVQMMCNFTAKQIYVVTYIFKSSCTLQFIQPSFLEGKIDVDLEIYSIKYSFFKSKGVENN